MSGWKWCPDCDGLGTWPENGQTLMCASCEGRGVLTPAELRQLLEPPPDFGEVLGALMIFAFLFAVPCAIAWIGMSRAVA